MSEAAAATPPPPAPVVPARSGPPVRTYVLAGCSIGGTLCASMASAATVNIPFAILSAVFGGIIVLVTAAPGVVAAAATAAPAAVASTMMDGAAAPPAAAREPSPVTIGISAAVLIFIVNQIFQFAVGYTGYGVAGTELTLEQQVLLSEIMGFSIIVIRVPFDLLIGAYLVSHARSIIGALGVFVLAYLGCYLVEQSISAAFGASGLYMTAQQHGVTGVMLGFIWVLGMPLLCLALGAYGAKLAAWFTRRKG